MNKDKKIKKSALAPTILIAGGAGFIGSHLAEVLLQKEARVIILDNFSTGKKSYVNHLLQNPKFALYDVDINLGLPPEIESADYIIHLAGLEEYLYDKDEIDLNSLLTNAVGTKNLLDFTQRSQAKFLLVSTIDIYEGMMSQLTLEDYFGKTALQEKKYSLSEAKRYAEALVWEYHIKHGTDARIARVPEVYGPRMSFSSSGTMGRLLRDLTEGRNFVLKGDGTQKEFYLFITDAVSGIVKALLTEETTGKIYTLVDKKPIAIVDLAFLIKELADRPVYISFDDAANYILPKEFIPDTFNLSGIKWSPKVSLKKGIISTLDWVGYAVNEDSFKNAKYIRDKEAREELNSRMNAVQDENKEDDKEELFSLGDIKKPISEKSRKDLQEETPPENFPQDTEKTVEKPLELKVDLDEVSLKANTEAASQPNQLREVATYEPKRIYSAYSPQVAPNQHVVIPERPLSSNEKYYSKVEPRPAGSGTEDQYQVGAPGSDPLVPVKKRSLKLSIRDWQNKRRIKKLQRRIDKLEREKNGPKQVLSSEAKLLTHKTEKNGLSIASKITLVFVVIFAFLAVFIIFPLANIYKSSKTAISSLESASLSISRFNTEEAATYAMSARDELERSSQYLASLAWVYKLLGKQAEYVSTARLMSSVENFSKVVSDFSLSAKPYAQVWETLKPNSNVSFDPSTLDNTKLHISDARNNLQLAIADFQQVNGELLPQIAKDGLGEYEALLSQMSEGLDLAWAFTADLPQILGYDGAKRYLVLFQNNNEMRPTGGFIGSYAFLFLEFGKIQELTIDDIYNPDGQIDVRNIKVLPPKPIGDFLSEDRLYIRNANWDPDFPRSAAEIKELFYRLNGEEIDGVIAVDLDFVRRLLDATGPLFLAAYNEEINSENLYERTQFHASYDYEDGSQQKRQFLTVLGSKLLESLFSIKPEATPQLLEALNSSLMERHLQIHLFSSPLNGVLLENNWSGSIRKTEGDYLQVVNANLGGTKANYYVKEQMDYRVASKTRDGLLRGEVTLNYTHTGMDESWPGGPYTNYLRILTQKGTKLTGAKIIYDASIEQDIMKDIKISEVDPYTSFETSFILDPSSSVKLVISYDLPVQLSVTKDSVNYDLIWQKQAGTTQDAFTYSFALPFGMEVDEKSNSLNQADGTLFKSGTLDKDFEASIKLK